VVGPAIADDRLGGAGAWAAILTAGGVGAIAGPLAVALGTSSALWLAAAVILSLNLTMLLLPAVWRVQARPAVAPVAG
jgi:uncharacterized membrane protein YoaK (UPF0700 family)